MRSGICKLFTGIVYVDLNEDSCISECGKTRTVNIDIDRFGILEQIIN